MVAEAAPGHHIRHLISQWLWDIVACRPISVLDKAMKYGGRRVKDMHSLNENTLNSLKLQSNLSAAFMFVISAKKK